MIANLANKQKSKAHTPRIKNKSHFSLRMLNSDVLMFPLS